MSYTGFPLPNHPTERLGCVSLLALAVHLTTAASVGIWKGYRMRIGTWVGR